MTEYRLYGVSVRTDCRLFATKALLASGAPGGRQSIHLQAGAAPFDSQPASESIHLYSTQGREVHLYSDRPLNCCAPGQVWQIDVAGVIGISWVSATGDIRYHLGKQGSPELLAFWFTHILLPLYLTLEQGYDFIHAAAVEIDAQPVLFIAPSTGGKSTLGDYFLRQGHPMLSDDKVATFLHEGQFWASPSHPHHRPFREFEVLGYPIENFATQARPIRAFYVLQAGDPDSDVLISELTGLRKFEQLMPNYLFNFSHLQEQRLRWLAQLADSARIFTIRRPWNLDRQHETYEAICGHCRAVLQG